MAFSTFSGRGPARITLMAGLALLIGAPLAFVQPAPGAAAPQYRHEHMQRMPASSAADRAEARLAYARTLLKIKPEQETRWTALAEVVRRHATERDAAMAQHRAGPRPDRSGPGEQTVIQRLERQQQMSVEGARRMEARARALGEVIAAARPLYESLDPDQRKVADSLLQHHGMAGHQRGPHGSGPQHRPPHPRMPG